jgi:glycosyltransferase involved in cell wall biosynthesis
MIDKKDVYVVIPAFNEASAIGKVLKNVKSCGFLNTIVVDDCSKDATSAIAKKSGAIVIQHSLNRGAGITT